MKKILFLFYLILSIGVLKSQNSKLSPSAQVYLITVGAGTDLYSVFGHTAIRIKDSTLKIDVAYNYGTFDFDDPNFYAKFVKGDLQYMLSKGHFVYFLQYYIESNRSVFQQNLNLSLAQKQKIFDFLEWNALPENKFYLYDFFFRNCASVVRDVFENQLADSLVFQNNDRNFTFRNLLHQYLQTPNEWNKLGIDLILGARTDRKATPREYMFLPDYLMWTFEKASIKTANENQPISDKTEVLYLEKSLNSSVNTLFVPEKVFWTVFIFYALVSLAGYFFKKRLVFFDFLWLFAAGVGGFILFFAWFFTNHTITVNNFNLAWLPVTHLIFAFFVFYKKNTLFHKIYLSITIGLIFMLLVGWGIIPQALNIWIVPLLLTFLQRSLFLLFYPLLLKINK